MTVLAPAFADTRCVLDPSTVPASFDDLPPGACSLAGVSTDGEHTMYAASEDLAGKKQLVLSNVSFEIDPTPPGLSPTFSSSPIYLKQTGVTVSPNASDATGRGVLELWRG